MTKKLLFGMMSLAALSACTSDEIESIEVAESKGNVQFVLMDDDAATRASMGGTDKNTVIFSATDGDLFTLYHGAADNAVTNFQNATYKAQMSSENNSKASLTTPSMILPGQAIMVYPADLLFDVKSSDNLSIQIPVELEDVAKSLPYVSDGIMIGTAANNYAGVDTDDKNSCGYQKEYPIYMRPMASQLNLKTDYAGTTTAIEALYEDEDGVDDGEGIEPIKVTAISVSTKAVADGGTTPFTQKINLTLPAGTNPNWFESDGTTRKDGNSWNAKTTFGTVANSVATLKSTSLNGNDGCKLLFLKHKNIPATGVEDGAVTVETQYGKVVVGEAAVGGAYNATEIADAWYRYISATTDAATGETKATTAEADGTFKTTSEPKMGMAQTINTFSNYTIQKTTSTVYGEEAGTAATRYVKVLLTHLDMSALHIKSDKQLRDVVRVWQALGLPSVTVYLDGEIDENDVNTKVFTMSQKTVDVINEKNAINAGKQFKVKPCKNTGEECETIKLVQTTPEGAAATNPEQIKEHSLLFVVDNEGTKVKNLILANETTDWVWDGSWLISDKIEVITNEGTLKNAADATIAAYTSTVNRNTSINLVNKGKWNVTTGTLRSQIDVRNDGELNISVGAEFLEDGYNAVAKKFFNRASTKPARFLDDPSTEKVGIVRNNGVFATIGNGEIHNYGGLIRHGMAVNDDSMVTKDAKTYITSNEQLSSPGGFGVSFKNATPYNRMGTIELPYSNKDEDNISISANPDPATAGGFVMVTTKDETEIDMMSAGAYVNYLNVKGAATSLKINTGDIDYIEFNTTGTEVVFEPGSVVYDFEGMIVLSNINIKLGTTVNVKKAAYLGNNAKMYVGGAFTTLSWSGYFGNTAANVATKYITY